VASTRRSRRPSTTAEPIIGKTCGHAFDNILSDLPGGFIELDITRIHDTQPLAPPLKAVETQESAVRAS
jgi:hypothetical protein